MDYSRAGSYRGVRDVVSHPNMNSGRRPLSMTTGELGFSERLNKSWDANAQAWTATVRDRGIESRRVATDQAIVDAVLRLSPGAVLDVGCGEGWLCRELRACGITCTGVDGSSELIEAAQTADPDSLYHLLSYADFNRLADVTARNHFDVAVCNFSLLHDDIRAILDAVRGVLRPGGVLLVQTVHPWTASGEAEYVDGWRAEDFAWSARLFPQSMPWYFRTLESWIQALSGSDFLIGRVAEPLHPEQGRPLSLLLSAIRPGG